MVFLFSAGERFGKMKTSRVVGVFYLPIKQPLLVERPRPSTRLRQTTDSGFLIRGIMKTCSDCKKTKDLREFRRDKRSKDGHYLYCRECAKVRDRKYYEGHKDQAKKYYQENKEKLNNRSLLYRILHPDYNKKWRDANPDYSIRYRETTKARVKRWITKNPKKFLEKLERRYAREKNAVGNITAKEWRELKKRHNYTCLCCKRKEPEIKLTLDHVIPLSKGGTNTIDNAQPLCDTCNKRKGNKMIDYR